jgi:hypothetical protein
MKANLWLSVVAVALCNVGGARVSGDEAFAGAWAVVAENGENSQKLAALIGVSLSEAGVELVERERIAAVLAEQELAAKSLADSKHAVRLGKLLEAEALVYVERISPRTGTLLRVRVIETRTGIRLWDRTFPRRSDDVVRVVAQQLPTLRQKLSLAVQDRRYIGFLGFVAEDEDRVISIQGMARTLQALLAVDLQRHPNLVVLERSDLYLVREESELSGLELQLRSSAILVAGGIRRGKDKDTIDVDIRLTDATGSVLDTLTLSASDVMEDELRRRIRAAVLGDKLAGAKDVELTVEATQFESRAEWLQQHKRYEEALVPAYAAAALEPSLEHYDRLRTLHHWICLDRKQKGKYRLAHASAAHEQHLKRIELAAANNTKILGANYMAIDGPFWPHVPLFEKEPEDVSSERRRLDSIREHKYRRLRSVCADRPNELIQVLIARLALAAYFASSPEELCDEIMLLQKDIDRTMRDVQGSRWRSFLLASNAKALTWALWTATVSSMKHQHTWGGRLTPGIRKSLGCRDWDMGVIEERCQSLRSHKEPALRLVINTRLADLGGADACEAAERAFRELRSGDSRYSSLGDIMWYPIAHRLRECGRSEAVVETMIAAAETTGDLRELHCWRKGRLEKLLSDTAPDIREVLLARANKLRARPNEISGPWGDFDLVRRNVGVALAKNRRLAARLQRASAVISNGAGGFALRTRHVGNAPNQPEPTPIALTPLFCELLRIEPTPTGIFCGESKGLFFGGDGTFENITDGLRGASPNMRYFDGHLYFQSGDGLSVLDCQTRTVRNIASSLRTVPRHELDGGANYRISRMFLDASRKCLWFDIREPGEVRNGIWKYSIATNDFAHVIRGEAQLLNMTGDEIFYWQEGPAYWHVYHLDSRKTEHLQGYRPFTQTARAIGGHSGIRVGDFIIHRNGTLYTRDGLQHRYPDGTWWALIEPTANGFRAIKYGRPDFDVWEFTRRPEATRPPSVARDLLRSVDIKRDALRGDWRLDGGLLRGQVGKGMAKLHLPIELPDAFELRLTVTPRRGSNLFVTMARGGAFFYVGIDHTRNGERFRSGIGAVDTKGIIDNETGVQERALVTGKANEILISVRPGHIVVEANGSQIAQFSGDFARLSHEPWMKSHEWPLALICENSSYEFREIMLSPLTTNTEAAAAKDKKQ